MAIEIKESPWIEAKKRTKKLAELLSESHFEIANANGKRINFEDISTSFYIVDQTKNRRKDQGFFGKLFFPDYNLAVCVVGLAGTNYKKKTSIGICGREYINRIKETAERCSFPVEITLKEEQPGFKYPNHPCAGVTG